MGKRSRERRRQRQIAETTAPIGVILTENDQTATLAEATGRAMSVRLISPGWGSSGYYSPDVIERDGPKAFPPGTHMYFDHPTVTEAMERPERSLRDLAGVLESGARWVPDHPEGPGLYAEAVIFEAFRPAIREAAEHIGVSIRARGTRRQGEAEGRTGNIILTIDEALSADFVTQAGRGGAIVDLLESARAEMRPGEGPFEEARNIGEWYQSRIHLRFTELADDMFGDGRLTKPERIALSSAIGAALDAFDDSLSDEAPQLYDRDLWDQPQATPTTTVTTEEADMADLTDDQLTKIGEAAGAAAAAAIKPLIEGAGGKPVTESKPEGEGEGDELTESQRKDREELLFVKATDAATKAFAEGGDLADAGRTLPPTWVRGLVEAAAKDAPHDDQLRLDHDRLVEGLKAAATQRVAEFTEATGAGKVTGMGGAPLTESDPKAGERLDRAFQDLGLSESEAKAAVAGR